MQTDILPFMYRVQLEAKRDKEREIIKKKMTQNNSMKKPIVFGGGIGFIWGVVTCVSIYKNNGAVFAVIAFLISGFLGMLLGAFVGIGKEKRKANLEQELQKIEVDIEREVEKYSIQFKENAQSMSTQFAESALAKESTDWLTNEFCKEIESADKSSYIENICVPFKFYVATHKIWYGNYSKNAFDFQNRNFKNLNSELEAAALARAVAQMVEANVRKYTGINRAMKVSYSDYNRIHVVITYNAPNKNYVPVLNW